MTHRIEHLTDVGVALGKGVYSVVEDFLHGLDRTSEGLGAEGWDRVTEIGFENEQLAKLVMQAIETPFEKKNPLYKAIKIILIEYYSHFPEHALKKIAEKGSMAVGFLAGRMAIGTFIARKVAMRILLKIAASKGFKTLFTVRLGVSARVGKVNKGIAAIVMLLMAQGVAQRASKGRKKLEKEHPLISKKLKQEGNLDLLFFLIEGPMEKHLSAIQEAKVFPKQFEDTVSKIYVH